ncbi:MAG: DMT family transporter [Bacteroidota bacterium]
MSPSKLKAHSFIFLANVIYGANYTIAKHVMPQYLQPIGFVLLRVIGAFLLFFSLYNMGASQKIEKKDFRRLVVCSLFGIAINQIFFFEGLSRTTPINASIIMVFSPILVLIISNIINKEKISFAKVIGIVLGFCGAFYLITKGGTVSFTKSENSLGDVLIFLNSISWSIYLVLIKSLMKKYETLTVMKWVFLFGIFWILPFGWNEMISVDYSQIPGSAILAILYVIVFTTFLAYWLNNIALKTVEPSVVGIYIYLQPLLASFFAILLGKDFIDGTKIVSAILIFAGVYLASFYKHKTTYEKS